MNHTSIPPEVAADMAETFAATPHGERRAFAERMAAEHSVSRATIYRLMQPFRRERHGRIQARHGAASKAAEMAREAGLEAERARAAAERAEVAHEAAVEAAVEAARLVARERL